MRDYKKFCRPKTTNNPKSGDYEVTLNCGNKVYVSKNEFEKKINKFFKNYKKYGSDLQWIKYTDGYNIYIAAMYNDGEIYIGFIDSEDNYNSGPIESVNWDPSQEEAN